jgi:hypothetical protein
MAENEFDLVELLKEKLRAQGRHIDELNRVALASIDDNQTASQASAGLGASSALRDAKTDRGEHATNR